ncbi:MAG: GGDEF domain-containing protein, partial [Planctomycetia bacterium]|nr:GGDEF domain-containing protein [Planctomycetia bacterium]
EDLFARYGGEEFALVLVEASPQGASDLAERIRVLVEQKSFEYEGKPFNLTISLGVAAVNGEEPVTVNDLLQRADDRLLEAKRTGRNRVVG